MRILLVDDQQLVREGIRGLLSRLEDASFAEASGKAEALNLLTKFKPDVVLLASSLREVAPVELIKRLRRERPAAHILVLGRPGEVLFANRALSAGARGFVSKAIATGELVLAVRKVASGQRHLDQATAAALSARKMDGEGDLVDRLTARQIAILRELAQGHGLQVIADKMGVSYKTIANTCSSIKSKFGLKRTSDLVRLAMELDDI